MIELKAASSITGLHLAQAMAYLRLANKETAMVYNFNVLRMREGGYRRVLNPYYHPA